MPSEPPVAIDLLNRYGYFFAVPLAAIQSLVMWFIGRPPRDAANDDSDAWRQFCVYWFLWYAITLSLLGVLQQLGKFESFIYFMGSEHANPYVVGARLVVLVAWLVMLVWIVRGGGAETLAAHPRRWRNDLPGRFGSKTPFAIKLQFVIIILAMLMFLIALDLSGAFAPQAGKRF